MFTWLKRLTHQQNASELQPILPDEPLLCVIQEISDYLIAGFMVWRWKEKRLARNSIISNYTAKYPISSMGVELRNFLNWLTDDWNDPLFVGASTAGRIYEGKSELALAWLEGGEFLAEFVENETTLSEFFSIEGNYLFYRDIVNDDMKIRVKDYVRENYFRMISIE